MKRRVRAVVCDVYGTLMSVEPTGTLPAAQGRWRRVCQRHLGGDVPLSWPDCRAAIEARVRVERAAAREGGIPHPEVDWEGIMVAVLPGLADLSPEARQAFLLEQAGIGHRVAPMPGAGGVLRRLSAEGVLLGIASNAQPYTLAELGSVLEEAGARPGLGLFDPSLRFWSFDHGFSKPDPHVFRILSARLAARGIAAGEVLMVGDRVDNDVEPARRAGWLAWELSPSPSTALGGDWAAFGTWWDSGAPIPA